MKFFHVAPNDEKAAARSRQNLACRSGDRALWFSNILLHAANLSVHAACMTLLESNRPSPNGFRPLQSSTMALHEPKGPLQLPKDPLQLLKGPLQLPKGSLQEMEHVVRRVDARASGARVLDAVGDVLAANAETADAADALHPYNGERGVDLNTV